MCPQYSRKKLALILLLSGFVSGCDSRPTRVPVAGQVRINGEPLKFGYIRFVPVGARPSGSQIGEDGSFRLTCFDDSDGAVLGQHAVEVISNQVDIKARKMFWHAPKKYSTVPTSGLSVEISEPTDDLIIELESTEKLPIEDPDYRQ